MAHLNSSYVDILNGPGNPSEKFWALEKRIKQDKRHPGVIVEMSKRNMIPTVRTCGMHSLTLERGMTGEEKGEILPSAIDFCGEK